MGQSVHAHAPSYVNVGEESDEAELHGRTYGDELIPFLPLPCSSHPRRLSSHSFSLHFHHFDLHSLESQPKERRSQQDRALLSTFARVAHSFHWISAISPFLCQSTQRAAVPRSAWVFDSLMTYCSLNTSLCVSKSQRNPSFCLRE